MKQVAFLVSNKEQFLEEIESKDILYIINDLFNEYVLISSLDLEELNKYKDLKEIYIFGKYSWIELTKQKENDDFLDFKIPETDITAKFLVHYKYISSNGGRISKSFFANQLKLINSSYSRNKSSGINIKIVTQDKLDEVLNIFLDEDPLSDVALDVETNGENVWHQNFKLLGFSIVSNYNSYFIIINDPIEGKTKLNFLKFLRKKKPWTYNCKFEISVFWKLFGIVLDLNDVYALCKINSTVGSLKENAVKFLNIQKWNNQVEVIIEKTEEIFDYFVRLNDEFLFNILKQNSSFEDIKVAISSTEQRIAGNCWKKVIQLQEILNSETETARALCKFPYPWEAIPIDILGIYCGLDSFYTLKLKELLYENSKIPYPYFIKQSYLACKFEAFGICWNDDEASKLQDMYLFKQNNTLKDLILLLDFPEDIKNKVKSIVINSNKKIAEELKSIFNPLSTSHEAHIPYINIFRTPRSITYVAMLWLERTLTSLGIYDELFNLFVIDNISATIENLSNFYSKNKRTYTARKLLSVLGEFSDKIDGGIKDVSSTRLGVVTVKTKFVPGELFKGFSIEVTQFHYEAYIKYCPMDIEDSTTWPIEFLILFLLKTYKKIEKVLSVYINGTLGRHNIFLSRLDNPILPPTRLVRYNKLPKNYSLKENEVFILNTSFRENVADTRRWSSGWHTIPAGAELRRIFIPRKEDYLVSHFDYGQNELRCLAAFAEEHDMIDAFLRGEDIHRFIASFVYNKKSEEITKNERTFSKLASFCLHPDTKILLFSGKIEKISEIKFNNNLYVFSYDIKKKETTIGKVKYIIPTVVTKNYLKIIMSDNSSFSATKDHEFLNINGIYIQAKNLKIGDLIQSFDIENQFVNNIDNFLRVDFIEKIKSEEDIQFYDIEVENYHNFSIIDNSNKAIFVHNSIVYGKSISNFAADFMKGDVNRAKELFDTLFNRFPKLKKYIDKMKEIGRTTGIVKSLFQDEMVVLQTGKKDNPKYIAEAERCGVNYPIQNTASAISALSIFEFDNELNKKSINHVPLGFVHDAGDFEFQISRLFEFIDILKLIAVDKARKDFGIPVDIEWEIGINMYEQMELIEVFKDINKRTFKFKVSKDIIDSFILKLKKFYNISYIIESEEDKIISNKELFAEKTPYSINIGKTKTIQVGTINIEPLIYDTP